MNPTVQDRQTTQTLANVVQSTTNYDQFTFLTANRVVNDRHVMSIRKSFEEDGNFTQQTPILVNERLQVIDGQHRLTACRELGLPVFYTVVPGIGAREAQKMNLLHRKWDTLDYLHVYIQENKAPYVRFQQLMEEYPDITPSLLIIYVNGYDTNGIHARFRSGDLKLNNVMLEKARKRLERLTELQGICDAFKMKPMAVALLRAMNTDVYKHRKMVEKVRFQVNEIHNYQLVQDNLRQLEDVFNWHTTQANKVRFF